MPRGPADGRSHARPAATRRSRTGWGCCCTPQPPGRPPAPAVVVGLSLGGYLGIVHAARRPEQVAGLVAAGCSSIPNQSATAAWLLAARDFAHLPDRGAWLNQRLVRTALPPEGAQDVAAGGFALEVMVDLLSAMRRVDIVGDLRRVTCPVWLVNG